MTQPAAHPSRLGGPIVFACDAAGFGGAEILAARLAATLRGAGGDVRFLCGDDAARDPRLRSLLGDIPVTTAPVRNKGRYPLRSLGAQADRPRAWRLARSLAALEPGAVVVNLADPEDGITLASAALALEPRPKVLGLLHCPEDLETLGVKHLRLPRTALARRHLQRFDRVLAVSQASAVVARRSWGVDAMACANGIPLPEPLRPGEREEARGRLGIPMAARAIGALGRLSREKGFADLIEAAPAIRSAAKDAVFVVGGDGPLRGELEAQVRSAGLADAFRFLGWTESRPFLASIDILAMPSRFEGLPLVLLEAGALGIDVIGAPVGGIPEVLEPSALVTGPAALAETIAEGLVHPVVRQARGQRLRERIHANHSIEAMAERFLRLL